MPKHPFLRWRQMIGPVTLNAKSLMQSRIFVPFFNLFTKRFPSPPRSYSLSPLIQIPNVRLNSSSCLDLPYFSLFSCPCSLLFPFLFANSLSTRVLQIQTALPLVTASASVPEPLAFHQKTASVFLQILSSALLLLHVLMVKSVPRCHLPNHNVTLQLL